VVLNVAGSKGGRLKKVFSFVFGTLAGGDDAALEVCVVSDFDLIAVFSGINTTLLGYGGMVCFDFALAVTAACTESVTDGNLDIAVLLFALIGFSILNTFYMQVARMAAPASDAITPLFDLISSLICSGSRLALNSPVCGSIAVLPSLYRWARCSAAFSAATAAEPPAVKLPPLTRAIAAPKRKCPIA